MNMTQRIAIIAVAILSICTANLTCSFAQSPVAIVDVGQVFDSHPGFKQELENLRLEAEALQNTVNQQRMKLAKDQESLGLSFTPGSDAYKNQEKDIALAAAKLDVDARDKMRTLMTREAHVHYDTYTEVNRYIAEFCQENGLRLVLRHSDNEMKLDDPESIMQKINSPVVYFRPEKDITPAIVAKMLQAKSGTTNQ